MATTLELEANDTRLTANAFSINNTKLGQLSSATDIDFYRFTISSLSTLNLSFLSPTNSLSNTSIFQYTAALARLHRFTAI